MRSFNVLEQLSLDRDGRGAIASDRMLLEPSRGRPERARPAMSGLAMSNAR
jgi:hypothetical protein